MGRNPLVNTKFTRPVMEIRSEGPNRLRRMYERGTKDVCTKEVFHYIQKWVPIFFVDLVAIRAQVTGIITFCIYKRIDQLVLVGKKM